MLTEAAFISAKYSKKNNIFKCNVKQYFLLSIILSVIYSCE